MQSRADAASGGSRGARDCAALLIAARAKTYAQRLKPKHAKLAAAITTLTAAVADTRKMLGVRGSSRIVLGAVAYLCFDMLVLWSAFTAIHAHPVPGFAVVAMSYLIGALGGSIPLPASLGSIGGMTGMFVLYGVDHNDAIAAVVLYQAIGLLVPLIGGGTAYLFLRRQFGSMRRDESDASSAAMASGADHPR